MCNEESDVYKQLDAAGMQRYREKLHLLGLTSDPHVAPIDAFVQDPETWPAVDFMRLFDSFTKSLHKRELKAYKSTRLGRTFHK